MTTLNLVPTNPAALDGAADPAAFVLALVDHARTLLEQARGMEGIAEVIEVKSRAAAIETYTRQKDMGHEAELSAGEIVRRAERRIGELVREGQADGEIRRPGEHATGPANQHSSAAVPDGKSSAKALFVSGTERNETYAMTDGVSDDEFEAAMDEAKAEGNVSRSNVVRKIKEKAPKPAASNGDRPEILRKTKRFNSNRIVNATVVGAEISPELLSAIDYAALDRDSLDHWVSSLTVSIRSLTTLRNNLRKELTNG